MIESDPWNDAGDPSDDFDGYADPMSFGMLRRQVTDWHRLSAEEAKRAWLDLDTWVDRIRRDYGLSPTVVPPLWHRHPELVWELSALHDHWLASYDASAPPSAAVLWHRDFAEARIRLREWVAACGTKLDRDRPTRQTVWPGENEPPSAGESRVVDRDADFRAFVARDIERRTEPT